MSKLQIGQCLGKMNIVQRLDTFQFHHDFVLNDKIKPIPTVDLCLFKNDGKRFFFFNSKPFLFQFIEQALFLNVLQQSRAKGGVHGHGATDDASRQIGLVHLPLLCVLCVLCG